MYDEIVIGSGPAGGAMARGLRAAGHKVAVIERDLWGGTCPNYGCDPTKIMMSAVELKARVKAMQSAGITGELAIDWQKLQARKKVYTKNIPGATKESLQSAGVDVFTEQASFNADESLTVGEKHLQAQRYIIATGQQPALPVLEGQEFLLTSNDFLDFEKLPAHLVFLGAGPVALELAQIAAAAGSQVTVIAHGKRKINGFDTELAELFLEQLEQAGIHLVNEISLTKIAKTASGLHLTDDAGFSMDCDAVIAATGRKANVASLNLAEIGVKTGKNGILVNAELQSSNPRVFAIGDVIDKKEGKLTPVAGFEARFLVDKLLHKNADEIHYPAFPTIIFGASKLARVGETTTYSATKTFDMTDWYTYRRIADPAAKLKVYFNETRHIIGAELVSTIADEIINDFVFMIEQKLTFADIQKMLMAYPTPSSDLQYFF